ncbi:phage tail protein [Erythrobacter sp. JK5]|uniref:phage tail protein n=1 Tax=Erythrobacter sp. JK5 TaxID=2829500 RepID=UPI001BA7786F|nr:tail fiber protein [Erythrobacter sp. JK5]QUL37815.1 phage tail protein [Erythrobacter sp. JK5]
MDPFIGQIVMFGGNFAPRGWAFCDGQLLSIAQNTALFSILGTIYGGDGRTNFALPEMRGRVVMHEGNGPGLDPKNLGERGGVNTNTLTVNNLPPHNHTATLHAESDVGTSGNPTNSMLGVITGANKIYAPSVPAANVPMHPDSIVVSNTGSGQSFTNEPPYTVVNYIIALVGTFPSRN